MHCCAHNPTGIDPTQEQWREIAQVIKEKQLFPFFDGAYLGFATGDLELDTFSIRLFVEEGIEFFLAQSYAKNFGLYGERIGTLSVHTNNPSTITPLKSQISRTVRTMYSNPPTYGARVVATVLGDEELHQEWLESLKYVGNNMESVINFPSPDI